MDKALGMVAGLTAVGALVSVGCTGTSLPPALVMLRYYAA